MAEARGLRGEKLRKDEKKYEEIFFQREMV
jgi:hypothetical protein